MRWMILIIPLVLFALNEVNKTNYFKVLQERNNPYIFDKKARLELEKVKIEAQTKKKIAEFEYKRAVDTQKIKKETVIKKAQKEIEKEKVAISPRYMEIKVKEKLIVYGFIIALLLLASLFFLYRRYEARKERIELERLRYQKEAHEKELILKEKEIQAQVATKLIDALASGTLTKEQEEKLLQIASGNQKILKK